MSNIERTSASGLGGAQPLEVHDEAAGAAPPAAHDHAAAAAARPNIAGSSELQAGALRSLVESQLTTGTSEGERAALPERIARDPRLAEIAGGQGEIDMGASGAEVKAVQEMLMTALGDRLTLRDHIDYADGTWTGVNRQVLARFQRAHGLANDGAVNADTLLALEQATREGGPDPAIAAFEEGAVRAPRAGVLGSLRAALFGATTMEDVEARTEKAAKDGVISYKESQRLLRTAARSIAHAALNDGDASHARAQLGLVKQWAGSIADRLSPGAHEGEAPGLTTEDVYSNVPQYFRNVHDLATVEDFVRAYETGVLSVENHATGAEAMSLNLRDSSQGPGAAGPGGGMSPQELSDYYETLSPWEGYRE